LLGALDTVRAKVTEVYTRSTATPEDRSDPDLMLYSGGFFAPSDRHLMNKILAVPPDKLGGHLWTFQDTRLPLMLFRYRARNYPETLNLEETQAWDRDRRARLIEAGGRDHFTLGDFRRAMQELREEKNADPDALDILDKLDAWVLEAGVTDL
jgi:exodeoxyribonuclease-1